MKQVDPGYQPYERLCNAMIDLANRYARDGRWEDAVRLVCVSLELMGQPPCPPDGGQAGW